MTLQRVRPPGWPVNGKLSSAEVSAMDAQLARALDKTREGDTLEGIIDVAPTGGISLKGGAFVEAAAGGVMRTGRGGRFELGDDDVPTFAPGSTRRERRIALPLLPYAPNDPSAWTAPVLAPIGNGTGNEITVVVPMHDGARLAGVVLHFSVGRSDVLPVRFPRLVVQAIPVPLGPLSPPMVDASVPVPATVAEYSGQGRVQSAFFPAVVDAPRIERANFLYVVRLTDAFYPDAPGKPSTTAYQAVQLVFTAIEDMRFP